MKHVGHTQANTVGVHGHEVPRASQVTEAEEGWLQSWGHGELVWVLHNGDSPGDGLHSKVNVLNTTEL